MIQLIALIAGFIFLSGVMAMIDAAVLSVSAAEIEAMVMKGKRGGTALKKLHGHMTRGVVIIVAFTNMINVFGPIIVGQTAVSLFGNTVIGAITAILTFGTIILSEIIPKSLGVHYAPSISRAAAPIILFFTYLFFPLVIFLEWISNLTTRGTRKVGTEEQIKALVKLGSSSGYIEKNESVLITRAFVLNDKTAGDIMTPVEKTVGFQAESTVEDVLELMKKKRFSRYPVYGTDSGTIPGYVLARDIFEAAAENDQKIKIASLQTELPAVDYYEKSDKLLLHFKQVRSHLAAVKKEGEIVGIVSLEDVLEELVGEIEDETD